MAEQFFESKQAAAILKHAVLNQYVDPFTMKTGSRSPGGRVAFVDGYAGEGRYKDGTEGSPALLMRKAHELSARRQLECVFVEQDRTTCETLRTVVAVEGAGLVTDVRSGDIVEHLDDVLAAKQGVPLFVFLDPFGLMPPLAEVCKVFKRPRGLGAPATEVLVNFSTVGLRRIAGHLTSSSRSEATLARMDDVCGGGWWRDVWLGHAPNKNATPSQRAAAEEAVVNGYAREVAKVARSSWWTFDVRNRAHHRPAYHLVFFTRHQDGLHLFGEALSLGLERWRRAVFEEANAGTLFDSDDSFDDEEKRLAAHWEAEIEDNLRRLLAENPTFRVVDKYAEVYGSALGHAREKHLRAAWKRLFQEGVTQTDSKGKLIDKTIRRA